MSKPTPTRTYCKHNRPLPYCHQNCRTPRHWKFTQYHRTTRPPPGTGSLPSTIAPPDHPLLQMFTVDVTQHYNNIKEPFNSKQPTNLFSNSKQPTNLFSFYLSEILTKHLSSLIALSLFFFFIDSVVPKQRDLFILLMYTSVATSIFFLI